MIPRETAAARVQGVFRSYLLNEQNSWAPSRPLSEFGRPGLSLVSGHLIHPQAWAFSPIDF